MWLSACDAQHSQQPQRHFLSRVISELCVVERSSRVSHWLELPIVLLAQHGAHSPRIRIQYHSIRLCVVELS